MHPHIQTKADQSKQGTRVTQWAKETKNDINQLKTKLKQKRPKQSANWGIKQRKQCKQGWWKKRKNSKAKLNRSILIYIIKYYMYLRITITRKEKQKKKKTKQKHRTAECRSRNI